MKNPFKIIEDKDLGRPNTYEELNAMMEVKVVILADIATILSILAILIAIFS